MDSWTTKFFLQMVGKLNIFEIFWFSVGWITGQFWNFKVFNNFFLIFCWWKTRQLVNFSIYGWLDNRTIFRFFELYFNIDIFSYRPLYIRQNANDTTGEHSSVFLKRLRDGEVKYLQSFQKDFTRRFTALLGYDFSKFAPGVALQILDAFKTQGAENSIDLKNYFSDYDLERINLYALGVVDYHLIVDLLPQVVKMLFTDMISIKGLSVQQRAILVAIGLQHKTVDELATISLVAKLPPMPASQILGHFKRAIIKINEELKRLSKVREWSKKLSLPTALELSKSFY